MVLLIEIEFCIDLFLVVVFVLLLDNWKVEIEKFFVEGVMDVFMLYGLNVVVK